MTTVQHEARQKGQAQQSADCILADGRRTTQGQLERLPPCCTEKRFARLFNKHGRGNVTAAAVKETRNVLADSRGLQLPWKVESLFYTEA